MPENTLSQREVETVVRRKELSHTALAGSIFFAGVLPILALAKTSVASAEEISQAKYCIANFKTYAHKSNVTYGLRFELTAVRQDFRYIR